MEQQNIFKEPQKEKNRSVKIPTPPKWKLTNTCSFILGKKQIIFEQCGYAFTQKLILHQHTKTLTREKTYACPCVKSKIQKLFTKGIHI